MFRRSQQMKYGTARCARLPRDPGIVFRYGSTVILRVITRYSFRDARLCSPPFCRRSNGGVPDAREFAKASAIPSFEGWNREHRQKNVSSFSTCDATHGYRVCLFENYSIAGDRFIRPVALHEQPDHFLDEHQSAPDAFRQWPSRHYYGYTYTARWSVPLFMGVMLS